MEYIVILAVRLGLLLFSVFTISRNILPIKRAWQENDQKKLCRRVTWAWAGVLAGCMFLKMFGGLH